MIGPQRAHIDSLHMYFGPEADEARLSVSHADDALIYSCVVVAGNNHSQSVPVTLRIIHVTPHDPSNYQQGRGHAPNLVCLQSAKGIHDPKFLP